MSICKIRLFQADLTVCKFSLPHKPRKVTMIRDKIWPQLLTQKGWVVRLGGNRVSQHVLGQILWATRHQSGFSPLLLRSICRELWANCQVRTQSCENFRSPLTHLSLSDPRKTRLDPNAASKEGLTLSGPLKQFANGHALDPANERSPSRSWTRAQSSLHFMIESACNSGERTP